MSLAETNMHPEIKENSPEPGDRAEGKKRERRQRSGDSQTGKGAVRESGQRARSGIVELQPKHTHRNDKLVSRALADRDV